MKLDEAVDAILHKISVCLSLHFFGFLPIANHALSTVSLTTNDILLQREGAKFLGVEFRLLS